METAYTILVSMGVLGILIFVHELGHFLVAKWCKVGVLEFSIGFGRKIWTKQVGETAYSIGVVPLGGYVKMMGDDPGEVYGESSASAIDRSQWFLEKNLLSKAAIVLAGPTFNILFAVLFSISSFAVYGKVVHVEAPIVGEVFPDNPAERAGIKSADFVKSIDGVEIKDWQSLAETVRTSGGREMVFLIEREDPKSATRKSEEIRVAGTTDIHEFELLDDRPRLEAKDKPYKIGIVPATKREPVGLGEAALSGVSQVALMCTLTVRILKAVVVGSIQPSKVVGGPIAVFVGAAQSAKRGLEAVLDFMVLLSVSLAIFNLLPIPILDGGHLLFFLIEAVKGSPVSVRWQIIANQVGMVLLMALMIFALRNDVVRFM